MSAGLRLDWIPVLRMMVHVIHGIEGEQLVVGRGLELL
jgi:hypothetical protein